MGSATLFCLSSLTPSVLPRELCSIFRVQSQCVALVFFCLSATISAAIEDCSYLFCCLFCLGVVVVSVRVFYF